MELEHKFARLGGPVKVTEVEGAGTVIEGYASVFGAADKGRDVVDAGAYVASLARPAGGGGWPGQDAVAA